MSTTYEWLTVDLDGSLSADMKDTTPAELDRRLIIMQEIRAGRVVLPAQLDRYREALERIANYPASVPYPEKWVHWAQQAREALNGGTE